MKVNIKWQGKMHFLGRGAQEVDIPIDAAPSAGGEGKGASPMELLLMGVAGCTAIDIVSILEKSCSASNTVKGVAKINYRYEINGVV